MQHDALRNCGPELGHPIGEPRRHTPAVQRKIGVAGSLHAFIVTAVFAPDSPVVLSLNRAMEAAFLMDSTLDRWLANLIFDAIGAAPVRIVLGDGQVYLPRGVDPRLTIRIRDRRT